MTAGFDSGAAVSRRPLVLVHGNPENAAIWGPVLEVLDRDGQFLTSWGEGLFRRAHGIAVGPDDAVYCTDDLDHTVRKFTTDGRLLQTLGTSGQPSDTGIVGRRSGRLASLCRELHRGVRPRTLHVRKQLSARQGNLQLWCSVECIQADFRRIFRNGEDKSLQ